MTNLYQNVHRAQTFKGNPMRTNQKGVGLIEVLVSLILLSIAVLGYSALQMQGVAASLEASNYVQAINIGRDLSERIKVNREGLNSYIAAANPPATNENEGDEATTTKDCAEDFCSANEMAIYDYQQVTEKATGLGMSLAILNCQGPTSLKRKCIYVAWDETTPTNGTKTTDCTTGVAYVTAARCVIIEAYNYG